MFNSQMPSVDELPTSRQLLRSTTVAALVASALLATVVLPAEYGIDPTGIGSTLGLTRMGEMKREQAAAAAATPPALSVGTSDLTVGKAPVPAQDGGATGERTGEVSLTLAPNQGSEVKATMRTGDEMRYEWRTNGGAVNFELHGETFGAAASEYTTHEKGRSSGKSGTFRAPFAGTHGWFWRNRTSQPVEITVQASGAFEKFEQID